MLQEKLLIINLKCYENATGKNALELAKRLEKTVAAEKLGHVKTIIAVQPTDIRMISDFTSKKKMLEVFAQHIDNFSYGSYTGHITAEAVKQSGASGTLINHSEHRITKGRRLDFQRIKDTVESARRNGLISVVCAATVKESRIIARLNPDYIAVEPPELIGGNISVSTARPELITWSVQEVHKIAQIPVLCGAGIKTAEDIKKALELGAEGILVASGVVSAENPEEVLKDFIRAFE